ncbi:ATP-binding protein [Spirillospora sp. NPDC029432]|uniref:ATP-binding protein n=1 Tax=Spirillospora sp. NPDC029432 TaxID=3154599 RepID=UPI003454CE81
MSGLLGEVTLPGVDRSAAQARRFLRETLVPEHLGRDGEVLYEMALVVDELVGNAVRHTASGRGGKVTVRVYGGGGLLRVEVGDDGAGGARPAVRGEAGGESGRGLRIVEALALRWGYRAEGVRTVVWAGFVSA